MEIAIPWSALRPPDGFGPEAGGEIPPPRADAAARPDERESGEVAPATTPAPGDEWRVNFSRVQWPLVIEDGGYRKEREPVDWSDHPEDNWVWSPQGQIDMHLPERWGVVRFVEGEPE